MFTVDVESPASVGFFFYLYPSMILSSCDLETVRVAPNLIHVWYVAVQSVVQGYILLTSSESKRLFQITMRKFIEAHVWLEKKRLDEMSCITKI